MSLFPVESCCVREAGEVLKKRGAVLVTVLLFSRLSQLSNHGKLSPCQLYGEIRACLEALGMATAACCC